MASTRKIIRVVLTTDQGSERQFSINAEPLSDTDTIVERLPSVTSALAAAWEDDAGATLTSASYSIVTTTTEELGASIQPA